MFDFFYLIGEIPLRTRFSNINERGLTILESHILSMLIYQLSWPLLMFKKQNILNNPSPAMVIEESYLSAI